MDRSETGRALRDICREGLDTYAELGQELSDDGDGLWPVTPRVDEDLGMSARGKDELLAAQPPDHANRRGVVGIVRVEERDDDAGVEDGYRHSRRSFRRVPLG